MNRWETLIVLVLYICMCVYSFLGEHSEMAQDRLPLIVGSALGGLAFLVIAAIAILAIIFKRWILWFAYVPVPAP